MRSIRNDAGFADARPNLKRFDSTVMRSQVGLCGMSIVVINALNAYATLVLALEEGERLRSRPGICAGPSRTKM